MTVIGLLLMLGTGWAAEPQPPAQPRVYIAAALFNGRETLFNAELAERLEARGFRTILPQRDGFEFSRLMSALSGHVSGRELGSAAKNIIYSLDMGRFIPDATVVVANLDEPIDEGVVVEITYAWLIGKPVVCFRTDVRTPYGDDHDRLGGIHTFVAYQCSDFIRGSVPAGSVASAGHELDGLAESIARAAVKHKVPIERIPQYALANPRVAELVDSARLLFDGIDDLHSDAGLAEIARRYRENRVTVERLRPDFF